MIRNQWYVVLQSSEVKVDKPVGILRLGERLVFWRGNDGKIICQQDLCPHRGAALSIGVLKDDHLQCPFHGLEFDRTGRCVLIPANGRAAPVPRVFQVKTYIIQELHGYIYLWWGEPQEVYPSIPWFDDLDASFATSDDRDCWAVHYSRAIENQLDVFHLPFVHATTIGRGNRTVSDGPLTVWSDHQMNIWVFNRQDDGVTTAKRSDSLPAPARPLFLCFQFPHLWMNRISDNMRITVFFTPVDEDHCILYLRYYQRFVRFPVLRNIIAWSIKISSRVILAQDKRVVLTQRPKKTDQKMGEKLIAADKPIIEYRTLRRKLQEQSDPLSQNQSQL